ncbi:histidine kinase [Xaviernesmea oryzae]|uniref:Histidine kinase n=1 Tax=Xaviernesmea oryzae TaxID=464029 RepID=A0A1Q9B0S5_9HYPH|nr:GGDEF and EAL domain-containing protein [Xaviernesmea oryzae]OLP61567.1 histidine kinase [Xaviernesmea oryzae]SEL08123.1 PAS domain S-box-containing protein/diguanylate cyclase (GGDEF) domain-containing protein [Xaviernesmea oryzae]
MARTKQSTDKADAARPRNEDTIRLLEATRKLAAHLTRSAEDDASDGYDLVQRFYWMEEMVNHIPDFLYAKDREGRFLIANRAVAIENGFQDPRDLVGRTDMELHAHPDVERIAANERHVIETGQPIIDLEERALVEHDGERWLTTSKVPLRDVEGNTIGIVGISRDITDKRRAYRLLRDQARLLEMIAQGRSLTEILDQLLLAVEEYYPGILCSVLLLSEDGRTLLSGAAPTLPAAYVEATSRVPVQPVAGSCGTAAWRREPVEVCDIATDPLWASFAHVALSYGLKACWSTPIFDHAGDLLGTFAIYSKSAGLPTRELSDLISMAVHLSGIAIERHRTEERIAFMAHHDGLTGLPNRALFDCCLDDALDTARRDGSMVTLAFLDLDEFKLVNDSLGHHVGDKVIKTVARRIRRCLRPGDMVSRIGGDEFVVMLRSARQEPPSLTIRRMELIRRVIARPQMLDGTPLRMTCSMGVATANEGGDTASELIANADVAMYAAKRRGRNTLLLFRQDMALAAQTKLRNIEELRRAIDEQQFHLEYQPLISVETGRVFGVEALVRWNHPTRGRVPPADFIPLAEETGLIVSIGDWVLRTACAQAVAWGEEGLRPLTVAVNVSARQFREKGLHASVAAALSKSGLSPERLELELTESAIMEDVPTALFTMNALRGLGVHLAIDDFGTGYSSLSALKHFPVRRLKIDRSFIRDIPRDQDDIAITAAILSMAQKLNLQVIAEGVETEEQLAMLKEMGCKEAQGFLIGRPASPQAVAERLQGEADSAAG